MPGLPILCCKGQRSKSAALPFAAESDKLEVWRCVSKFPVIARPVRRLVVAIPRLKGTR